MVNDDGDEVDLFGEVETVEIAINEALSGVIDLRGYLGGLRLHMPGTWTSASIGIKEAPTSTGTYNPLYDENGSLIEFSAAASRVIRVEPKYLFGAQYIKLWSQNSGSDEDQAAAREIVVCKL
jgi:hypothetical protein